MSPCRPCSPRWQEHPFRSGRDEVGGHDEVAVNDATRAFAGVALVALLVAAALHLATMSGAAWLWPAYVELMIFGWISGMILSVSYHTIPAFTARSFVSPRIAQVQVSLWAIGLGTVLAGRLADRPGWATAGFGIQAAAAAVFLVNIGLLLTRSPREPGRLPPSPSPEQHRLDRLGTLATSAAALCLPLACALLAAAGAGWLPPTWQLAAEHLALLGWVMGTIVGVALHVLPRFTGRALRGPAWVQLELGAHGVAIVLIVLGLGVGWARVFALGAASMALAVGLFAWVVWPALASRPIGVPLPPLQSSEAPR